MVGDFGLGKYKAVLALNYGTSAELGGQGKQTLSFVKYFWVIPWRIITPLVSGLIFIIIIFVLFLKLYKNRAVKRVMKDMGLGRERYVSKYQGPSPVLRLGLILFVLLLLVFVLVGAMYFMFFA